MSSSDSFQSRLHGFDPSMVSKEQAVDVLNETCVEKFTKIRQDLYLSDE